MKKAVILPFLIILFVAGAARGKSYTSDIPYKEVESQVKVITDKYFELERLFKDVKKYTGRTLPRTGLSVSVIKKRKEPFRVEAVEVTLDGLPVYGHLYSEAESRAFDAGGRQLLYDESVDEGLHVVTVKAFLRDTSKKKRLTKKLGGVEIQVLKDLTFFLEVRLTGKDNKPYIDFRNMGQKKGVLGISK